MGSICPCGIKSIVDEDLTNEIQNDTGELVGSIPIAYKVERQRIIDEMRQASPNPYQGLLFADYPTKNGTAVSALARRNVTSDQVKEQITDQVNKRLQAKIERQLVQMNPMARAVVSKTIEKTIKAAVNEAVDAIVFNDNDTSMAATSSS